PPKGLFTSDLVIACQAATETYATLARAHPLSFAVFRQAAWYHHGLRALEGSQVAVRTPFLDNDLVQTAFRLPAAARNSDDYFVRLIVEGNRVLAGVWTNGGPIDPRVGRLTAAASRGVLEFLRKAEYAYDYGMPHWLATVDSILRPMGLERLFLGRQKF